MSRSSISRVVERRVLGRRSLRVPLGLAVLSNLLLVGCGAEAPAAGAARPANTLPEARFSAWIGRASEEGGYFDTDNLVSNESAYLKVAGALVRDAPKGGVYLGVGPDQNYSYIALIRPRVAFLVDLRRDNLLHHLLLKALIESAPGRVEFLSALHGRPPPFRPERWRDAPIESILAYVEETPPDPAVVERVDAWVGRRIAELGLDLTDGDRSTVRRFHQAFVEAGPGLRFRTFGRPPRPYYPTFHRLILETDIDGDRMSYLADPGRYDIVRELHLANRIIPVVGDLAGPRALREIGALMREMGLSLSVAYVSNVEFYLWREGRIETWRANLRGLPRSEGALLVRSVFPGLGRSHPSTVPGYPHAQVLQPVSVLVEETFPSYEALVTQGVHDLGR